MSKTTALEVLRHLEWMLELAHKGHKGEGLKIDCTREVCEETRIVIDLLREDVRTLN